MLLISFRDNYNWQLTFSESSWHPIVQLCQLSDVKAINPGLCTREERSWTPAQTPTWVFVSFLYYTTLKMSSVIMRWYSWVNKGYFGHWRLPIGSYCLVVTEDNHRSEFLMPRCPMPIANKYGSVQQKIMNKRAVLWFDFLSKRFGPGLSSVELQVR